MNIYQQLEARQSRRMAAEHRYLCRMEKLEAKAAPMVGELCREGTTVFYCWPAGGRYYESASHTEVVEYLIRNKWVSVH
jgi:hypothetical protein